MKNRYFILSVLFWAVASVSMAITLPSTSYSGSYESMSLGNDGYTLGVGTSFLNTASLGTSYIAGTCQVNKQDPQAMTKCEDCCIGAVFGSGGTQDEADYLACINDCMGVSLPLGTPLLLLPFALAYAFIRKKRHVTE